MDDDLDGRLRGLEAGVQRIGEQLEQQSGQQRQMLRVLEALLSLLREPEEDEASLLEVLAQIRR